MTQSKQELADEQLDAFLQELGVLSSPTSEQTIEKEPSFEHLLDEIIELTHYPSPPPATPSLPVLPLDGEKKKKRSHLLIWITATLLIGLFAGCAFGFFWAKNNVEPQEEIATQISYWINELTNLYEKLEPPENEIIEPIKPSTEMETLAPSEMT